MDSMDLEAGKRASTNPRQERRLPNNKDYHINHSDTPATPISAAKSERSMNT